MSVDVCFGSVIDGELVTKIGDAYGITAKCNWDDQISTAEAIGRTFRVTGLNMRTYYPIASGEYVMILAHSSQRFRVYLHLEPAHPASDPRTNREGLVKIMDVAGEQRL
ncbi:MAG: hypothetical protein H8E35_14835 [Ardenticatenia bacterium]|nr:hypothetical protein [Ardenticatenia bacterium]